MSLQGTRLITLAIGIFLACEPGSAQTRTLSPAEEVARLDKVLKGGLKPEAVAAFERRAVLIAKRALDGSDLSSAGQAMNLAAGTGFARSDWQLAKRHLERARDYCFRARNWKCFGHVENNAATVEMELGNPAGAARKLREASSVVRKAGNADVAARLRENAAIVVYDAGDLEGALAEFASYEREYGLGPDFDRAKLRFNQASLLNDLGRHREAAEAAQEALTLIGSGTPMGWWPVDPLFAAGQELARARGHLKEADAVQFFENYFRRPREDALPYETFLANASYAEVLIALGRANEAVPYMRHALENAAPRDEVRLFALAADMYNALGLHDQAFAMERKARNRTAERSTASFKSALADSVLQAQLAERTVATANANAEAALARLLAWLVGAIAVAVLLVALVALYARATVVATRQKTAATLAERTRVARELHDTLLQRLAGILFQTSALARGLPAGQQVLRDDLDKLVGEARRGLIEARDAVWDLRDAIEPATSVEFLRASLGELDDRRVRLDMSGDWGAVGMPLAKAVGRIAKEAVSNALRHGDPSFVDVQLAAHDGIVKMVVTDDGTGFRVQSDTLGSGGHWGILGMRERAAALGGRFLVESAPGSGTRVALEVPLTS